MNIAELVGRTLAQLGAGHVFGVVGSGNFEVTNALRKYGVPFTAARHEGGAATMADAYSRMSGTMALVSTHQGCGLTNAMTGIVEAVKSRTPLIVLAADTQAAAVQSNFNIDQDALARSVGAVPERVHSPASAVADVVRAYRTAVNDRSTVVLSLPLDIQARPAPHDSADPDFAPEALPAPPAPRASDDTVQRLAQLLAAAQRPVFVAGRGGRAAGAELKKLAQHAGALLATSAVAHGLFHDDKFSLGISGGFSSPATAELISGADLIVGWGSTLNMWTMRSGALISAGTVVAQVDLEDSALGANRPIDLGMVGDCAATARDVLWALQVRQPEAVPKYRNEQVRARIAGASRWQDIPVEDSAAEARSAGGGARGALVEDHAAADQPDGRIDARRLSIDLNALLPANRIVSVDSGNFMGYPSTHLSVPDEFGFCFTQAYQSIGLGLATAIGAALARPDRLPVLGTGDGGFLMGIAELETAVRLQLPLVIIVYNDAAYGAEVHHFKTGDADVDLETVTFPDTDFAAIARGYGANGITVRSASELAQVRQWLHSTPAVPLVIDAKIADDGGAWWLAEAFKGH